MYNWSEIIGDFEEHYRIDIDWHGPLTHKDGNIELKKLMKEAGPQTNPDDDNFYGIYQIYGTHPIFGPNSLLYIGKADFQETGTRLNQHCEWLEKEPDAVNIYCGFIMGDKTFSIDEAEECWSPLIDIAEKMLIYVCSPPYNSQHVYKAPQECKEDNILLFNWGKSARLPYVVSSVSLSERSPEHKSIFKIQKQPT